jgi:hypothetical protein
VTALSTGTVVAVGESFDSAGVSNGLILSNSWRDDRRYTQAVTGPDHKNSAPDYVALVDQVFAAVPKADHQLSLAGQSLEGTASAPPSGTMPTPPDARAVDRFFAAAGMEDLTLSLARHSARAHQAAENGDLDVLPEAI